MANPEIVQFSAKTQDSDSAKGRFGDFYQFFGEKGLYNFALDTLPHWFQIGGRLEGEDPANCLLWLGPMSTFISMAFIVNTPFPCWFAVVAQRNRKGIGSRYAEIYHKWSRVCKSSEG